MKILFLPAYFSPDSVAGSYLEDTRNEAFAKAGFKMEVYAPIPTRGISDEVRKEYKKKRIEKRYNGLMTIFRFPLYREGNSVIMRTIRYTLSCLIQFYKGCMAKDIDVIFEVSTPPIQGAMAALVKKVKGVPFIYCLQDIFPDSLVGSGISRKGSFLWKLGRIIENFIYRNADKIIVISQDFKSNIMAKGVSDDKIEVIYNWVDDKVLDNITRQENILFDKYCLDRNKFYITYCGNIGLTQNLDLLLKVAKNLEYNNDIQFVLIGEGSYKSDIEKLILKNGIKNIKLLPRQPYKYISHVFSLGDTSLVISKPGVGSNSVPIKMWNIMAAKRPVLVNFDENEIKGIIEDNKCGIYTRAGDEEALKDAILTLYCQRDICQYYGQNGHDFVHKNLTQEKGTLEYLMVLRQFDKCQN